MSGVAVAGAGQAGLQLALGLRATGYEVTLATDRTAAEIATGPILSTQCMFDDALATERALGIDLWQHDCPQIDGVQYSLGTPGGERIMCFSGKLPAPAQSVDQRLKMPRWLDDLEAAGGRVVTGPDVATLESSPLSMTCSSSPRPRAPSRGSCPPCSVASPRSRRSHTAQRELGVAYVRGMEPLPSPGEFSISIVPGVGEYFAGPALTLSGPCSTMCLEAVPGGPMDALDSVVLRPARGVAGRARGRPRAALPLGGRALRLSRGDRRASRRSGDRSCRSSASGSAGCRQGCRCSGSATRSCRTTRSSARAPTTRPRARPPVAAAIEARARAARSPTRVAPRGGRRVLGRRRRSHALHEHDAVAAAARRRPVRGGRPARPPLPTRSRTPADDPRTLAPYLGWAEGIAEFAGPR